MVCGRQKLKNTYLKMQNQYKNFSKRPDASHKNVLDMDKTKA